MATGAGRPAQNRQQQPASGLTRQQIAQQAAAAIAAVLLALEAAILAAMALAVFQVSAGRLLASMAARRMRATALQAATAAEAQCRGIIAQAVKDTRSDVQRVILADLGPLSRLLPLIPSPSVPRLSGDLHKALLAALGDADRELGRIIRAMQAAGSPAARAAIAQQMLSVLAARGLTGLTARNGTRWNVVTYAEMASAAALAALHVHLQLAAYRDAGYDLVIVTRSSPKPPCPKCAPWVGKVLSVSGQTTGKAAASDQAGNMHSVTVAGTLAQARAAGLLHPSCKDGISPFADGAAVLADIPHGPAWDGRQAARYAAQQDRSALEREQRQARREGIVALTPMARARARRRLAHLRRLLAQRR